MNKNGFILTSVATPIILGTKDHIKIEDPELAEEISKFQGDLEHRN